MRAALITHNGISFLVASLLAGQMVGGNETMVNVAKVFIVLWLSAAGVNMWIGVSQAGYSVAEELPIFLLIFALPVAAAAFVWWKFS